MSFYKEEVEEVINAVYKVTGDINVAKVLQQIKDLPIQEEKPGRWINCSGDLRNYIKCSNCKNVFAEPVAQAIYPWNFCPICGKRMGGEQNEHSR